MARVTAEKSPIEPPVARILFQTPTRQSPIMSRNNFEVGITMIRRSILFLVLLAGCGGSLPPMANPERATAALQAALDAWQRGETEQSLQARAPAIHVNEPDWRSGRKLVKFELGNGEPHAQSWRCEVTLILLDEGIESAPVSARYMIDTDPALVVVRE